MTNLKDSLIGCREAFNLSWPAARGMDLTTPEDHDLLYLIYIGYAAAWDFQQGTIDAVIAEMTGGCPT